MSRFPLRVTTASALAAAAFLSASLATPAKAVVVTVHIVNFDFTDTGIGGRHFDPTIHLGDTVEWVWDQGFNSTTSVAGIPESWNSTAMVAAGQTFDHTFTHVGDFSYYDLIHGNDNGDGTASGQSGIVHVLPLVSAPEPSSYALAGLMGLAGLGGAWKGRKAG